MKFFNKVSIFLFSFTFFAHELYANGEDEPLPLPIEDRGRLRVYAGLSDAQTAAVFDDLVSHPVQAPREDEGALSHLRLERCEMGVHAIRAIITFLNHGLERPSCLLFDASPIPADDMPSFLRACRRSRTLSGLSFTHGSFPVDALDDILSFLNSRDPSPRIRFLAIDGTPLSEDFLRRLVDPLAEAVDLSEVNLLHSGLPVNTLTQFSHQVRQKIGNPGRRRLSLNLF